MLSERQPSLPLRQRPIDIVILIFFWVNLLLITYIIDVEQLIIADPKNFTYPFWPPPFFVDIIHWYGNTFDPPLMARPAWWKATIWLDSIFFGPFYIAAIYAYTTGKAWIRLPSLLWATMMFTNVFIILNEEFMGAHATPEPLAVLGFNFPWLTLPFLVGWRVWRRPNPFSEKW